MQLVNIKAKTAITHGYRDDNGNVVEVVLAADEVGQVPAADAAAMHDRDLVYVSASDQEAVKAVEAQQTTETDEQAQPPQTEQAQG